jgi:hypothetical protein
MKGVSGGAVAYLGSAHTAGSMMLCVHDNKRNRCCGNGISSRSIIIAVGGRYNTDNIPDCVRADPIMQGRVWMCPGVCTPSCFGMVPILSVSRNLKNHPVESVHVLQEFLPVRSE